MHSYEFEHVFFFLKKVEDWLKTFSGEWSKPHALK